ncbi:hypothetical protein Lalb_Chr08g0235661 [Lupinus albus]|uniref:Uncharacterized protein n=1 Tax=Lupinus albus TaxID=3870 RepID=A0A6A4Q4D1_LUPAL|nr:hypothetical protein Lalb_Chr08g0235661 [Lupinus albus]
MSWLLNTDNHHLMLSSEPNFLPLQWVNCYYTSEVLNFREDGMTIVLIIQLHSCHENFSIFQ